MNHDTMYTAEDGAKNGPWTCGRDRVILSFRESPQVALPWTISIFGEKSSRL